MPKQATDARKQSARAEAETREQQFRTLANSIPQLAWMADHEGYIFWYNDRWYDYTGTTLEEMEGWGWQKVHHPDEVGRVVERIKANPGKYFSRSETKVMAWGQSEVQAKQMSPKT